MIIADKNHPSGQMTAATRDPLSEMGVGTKQFMHSGAEIGTRNLRVRTTNPMQRAAKNMGRATREERDRLKTGSVNVFARSGNQSPSQVNNQLADDSSWGMVGEEDTQVAAPSRLPFVLGAAVLAIFLLR